MKPNGNNGDTLYAVNMRRMADLLSDLYTPMEAQEWLAAKHPLLQNQVPAKLIADGRVDEVEELIEQLASGAFL